MTEVWSADVQGGLFLLVGIGNQASYKIGQEVEQATMARMLDLGEVSELINHTLDQLAPQSLVRLTVAEGGSTP